MQRFALLALLVTSAVGLAPAPADAWLQRFAGSRFEVEDAAVATAVDSRGHVVAVTVSEPDPGVCQVTASKRDGASGETLWTRPLGRCLYHTEAQVAVTATDDVVVGLPGFVLVKLAGSDGEIRWTHAPGEADRWSAGSIRGIVFDPAGDVIAAGDSVFNPFDDEDHDLAVVKVRGATGERVWRYTLNGEFPPCSPGDVCEDDVYPRDEAWAIALDPAGRVIVAGGWDHYLHGGSIVIALDPAAGGELWRYVIPRGTAIALVAGPDALYAGGYATEGPVVVRLDPATGQERWTRRLALDPNDPGGWVTALALDRSGDVLVSGSAPRSGAAELFVARLRSPQGQVAWRQALPPPTPLYTLRALRLVPGAGDTVGVLASTAGPGPGNPDDTPTGAQVSLLDARTGATAWRTALTGRDGGEARGYALAAQADGDLVVAGGVRHLETQLDATVARLRAGDGSIAWQVEENGHPAGHDGANAVATDAAGDAIVVGTLANAFNAGAADVAVVKLARTTGAVLWRRELDGVTSFGISVDAGLAVALDAAGDPIVGAQLGGGAALLKLDGATGAERWRTQFPFEWADHPAVDANGNVTALLYDRDNDYVATVVQVDGATGVERWRRPIAIGGLRFGVTSGLTITPDGTVVTASFGYDEATQQYLGVLVALAGDTGNERWRRVMPDTILQTLRADPAGRIVVALTLHGNTLDSDAVVAVLDGQHGMELAFTVVTPPALRPAVPTQLAFDGNGGLVVAGFAAPSAFVARLDADAALIWQRTISDRGRRLRLLANVPGLAVHPRDGIVVGLTAHGDARRHEWMLAGLSPRSGAVRWRRTLDGDETDREAIGGDIDTLSDLAMTPHGEAIAVGTTSWVAAAGDFTVFAVRARNGRERLSAKRPACPGHSGTAAGARPPGCDVPEPGARHGGTPRDAARPGRGRGMSHRQSAVDRDDRPGHVAPLTRRDERD